MKKTLYLVSAFALSTLSFSQTKNDSLRYNQYGLQVERQSLSAEARNGILVFESKDEKYKLWLDLRVHVDGASFWGVEKDYDPIGNGARIRRARTAIKANITQDWYGEIDLNFADGRLELKDAIIRYDGFSNTELQIGNFKENFSIARNTSSRYQQFMERPMAAQALAPSRHLGINAKYQKDWLYASGGIFFQEIEDAEKADFVETNNKDYGRNQGMSYTGKIAFQPLHKHDDMALHIGAGISYRTPKTDVDPAKFGGSRFSTRNSTSINRKKYIDTGVINNVNYDLLYTFELAGFYKGFRFESAFIQNDTHIKDSAPEKENKQTKHFLGSYTQVSYLLFGGQQHYDYTGGKFNQVKRGRDWGDIELALRYDYLDLNSRDIYGGSGEAYSIGLNYYVNNNVKFMLNYQYNNNDRYANGKGKLLVGHDTNGQAVKDPSKVVEGKNKAGVDYSMLSFRIELTF
ncbi:OprO/OprP family phosphate-selective porin [Myroides phaeus]|uniref:OprO/OprP family phosphate-selective porin n=1 Tax=Myroides phaeus TaxID=702745 RepID=UPI001303E95A|nr:porin [Myroides phaeus]